MDKSILHSFRLRVAERNLGVYGIHVYKEGEGELAHRFRANDYVNLYSASKTFASVGVGIALDEGLFALEDTALSFFPQFAENAAPGSEKITLRDLLHMSSGKKYFWAEEEKLGDMDNVDAFFRKELSTQPGEEFFYSNWCTYVLGRVVEAKSGQLLRDYLLDRLFRPLGIFNPQWHTCAQGHTIAATQLFLRTAELARLGRLLLQKGEWEGKRLVSASYIEAMASDTVDTGASPVEEPFSALGYGYQVWGCPRGAFRADGMYGQFSIVLPDTRAVVTLTSHNETRPQDILSAVFEEIDI